MTKRELYHDIQFQDDRNKNKTTTNKIDGCSKVKNFGYYLL